MAAPIQLTWSALLSCFQRISDLPGWHFTTFRDDFLAVKLKRDHGVDAPSIPYTWFYAGWSDDVEIDQYARFLVKELKRVGVEVIDVPEEKGQTGSSAGNEECTPILVSAL